MDGPAWSQLHAIHLTENKPIGNLVSIEAKMDRYAHPIRNMITCYWYLHCRNWHMNGRRLLHLISRQSSVSNCNTAHKFRPTSSVGRSWLLISIQDLECARRKYPIQTLPLVEVGYWFSKLFIQSSSCCDCGIARVQPGPLALHSLTASSNVFLAVLKVSFDVFQRNSCATKWHDQSKETMSLQ